MHVFSKDLTKEGLDILVVFREDGGRKQFASSKAKM